MPGSILALALRTVTVKTLFCVTGRGPGPGLMGAGAFSPGSRFSLKFTSSPVNSNTAEAVETTATQKKSTRKDGFI